MTICSENMKKEPAHADSKNFQLITGLLRNQMADHASTLLTSIELSAGNTEVRHDVTIC